jgi:ATP-dependent DNA ligase
LLLARLRQKILPSLNGRSGLQKQLDGTHISPAAIFRHACGLGLEGIVSKRVGSRYVSGRTRAWLKSKNPKFQRS